MTNQAKNRLKLAVVNATKTLNLLVFVAGMIAIAALQDKIGKVSPIEVEGAVLLQGWMTFLTFVFLYLGVTEVYDDSALMLFRPDFYERKLAY